MTNTAPKKRIAIIGGGPSGLFLFKSLIESGRSDFSISVFEAKDVLGAGMPYSAQGASPEHITNVSGNEIPELETSVLEWLAQAPAPTLQKFDINPGNFNDYKVLPRLLFGEYLAAQFELLIDRGRKADLDITIHLNCRVADVIPTANDMKVHVRDRAEPYVFDAVVLCTGHQWPHAHEGKMDGYFDSPYPPAKLPKKTNHPVAIRGSSLTAIDAIRTLARHNGIFDGHDKMSYSPHEDAPDFKIIMHSRSGLLPAVRFHLEDSHLSKDSLLSPEEIAAHMQQNGGFLSLDYIFEKDFKDTFKNNDPDFYERIKSMSIEQFVESMMADREKVEPFAFFEGEYNQAEKSIRRHESIYWKEALAVLSFAMNYPAKHLSAEDMQRLQKVLMPLISIVIAFVPQSSCRELIALHKAGRLELVAVGSESRVEAHPHGGIIYHYSDENGDMQNARYETYIDCIGQPHLSIGDFPFKGLINEKAISPARLPFKHSPQPDEGADKIEKQNGQTYLKVSGLAITDSFRAVDTEGKPHPRLHIMTVPFIGGFNPDYSGLDFCAEASKLIVKDLVSHL